MMPIVLGLVAVIAMALFLGVMGSTESKLRSPANTQTASSEEIAEDWTWPPPPLAETYGSAQIQHAFDQPGMHTHLDMSSGVVIGTPEAQPGTPSALPQIYQSAWRDRVTDERR